MNHAFLKLVTGTTNSKQVHLRPANHAIGVTRSSRKGRKGNQRSKALSSPKLVSLTTGIEMYFHPE